MLRQTMRIWRTGPQNRQNMHPDPLFQQGQYAIGRPHPSHWTIRTGSDLSTTITFTLTPDEQRQLLNMPISARWLKKPAAIRGIVILLVCEIFLIFTAVSNINQRQTTTGIAMLAAAGMFPYFILVTTLRFWAKPCESSNCRDSRR